MSNFDIMFADEYLKGLDAPLENRAEELLRQGIVCFSWYDNSVPNVENRLLLTRNEAELMSGYAVETGDFYKTANKSFIVHNDNCNTWDEVRSFLEDNGEMLTDSDYLLLPDLKRFKIMIDYSSDTTKELFSEYCYRYGDRTQGVQEFRYCEVKDILKDLQKVKPAMTKAEEKMLCWDNLLESKITVSELFNLHVKVTEREKALKKDRKDMSYE